MFIFIFFLPFMVNKDYHNYGAASAKICLVNYSDNIVFLYL